MTVASIGLSVVSAGAQYAGQSQYANQEAAAIKADTLNKYTQGQQQEIYHNEAASQKLEANTKAVRSAQGKLAAAASENGVGGLSIAALSNELSANAGHYASDGQYNRNASAEKLRVQ